MKTIWRIFQNVRFVPVNCVTLSIALIILSIGFGQVRAVAQGATPGRIVGSTGNGLIIFNTDGTNVFNLTENKGEHQAPLPPYQGVSDGLFPSVSLNGKFAFQLARDTDISGHGRGSRIFVMDPDGKVEQLTTTEGLHPDSSSGMFPDDRSPVISPDGSKVCFIARRNEVEVSPGVFSHPYGDVYVVNTDGTDLHQVTQSQHISGSGQNYSTVQSCVWKPDGSEIAFKGLRLHTDLHGQQGFHVVLGTINPDGTGETHIPLLNDINWLDSGGWPSEQALDWSPDGRYILVEYGGGAQGSVYPRYLILDLVEGGYSELNSSQLGPSFSMPAGSVRFSPASNQIIYLRDNASFSFALPTFINIDGTNRTLITNLQLPRYYPLWWMPGPAIPLPSRLELTPNPVRICQQGPSVQVIPTLYDSGGNIIVHGVTNWKIAPSHGSPAVSIFGDVVDSGTTAVGTFTLTATNGGLTASTQVIVGPPPPYCNLTYLPLIIKN
jgi:hypothetical protein